MPTSSGTSWNAASCRSARSRWISRDYIAFGTRSRQLHSELTNQLEDYLVAVPVNSNGKVHGFEFVYEQPIGEHFGFNANYTFADGETDHTWADGSHNLVGTSQDTYNAGLYSRTTSSRHVRTTRIAARS